MLEGVSSSALEQDKFLEFLNIVCVRIIPQSVGEKERNTIPHVPEQAGDLKTDLDFKNIQNFENRKMLKNEHFPKTLQNWIHFKN